MHFRKAVSAAEAVPKRFTASGWQLAWEPWTWEWPWWEEHPLPAVPQGTAKLLDEGWEQGVCPSSQSHHLLSILIFFVKVLSASI